MGKFFALLITVVTTVWLAPMCARLPKPGEPVAVAVAVPLAPLIEAPVEVAPPPPPPAAYEGPAVTVSTYRSRKMFTLVEGRPRVSVLIKNLSDRPASNMRLAMAARLDGKAVESARVNTTFEVEAGSSVYRGLLISMETLDAFLAETPAPNSELRWDLTYRLEGDEPDAKRCFTLRALPRQRDPEGIEWKAVGQSDKCEAAK